MKKSHSLFLFCSTLLLLFLFTGCTKNATLDPKHPVTLTMWHVYGEQVDSPMNRMIEEFNQTTGREKGILVNVTLMSNAYAIGDKLLKAQANTPGVPDMPDLFFCHITNAEKLGADTLLDWKEQFTEEEREQFVPAFVEDGIIGEKLSILPVSKSTYVLYLAGAPFARFSAATGVRKEDLSTWDGFFDAAEKYYNWSGGKPFCALDYLLRCVDLDAMEKGASNFYTKEGWYDLENAQWKASFMPFARALSKGHIVVSDLYSNTQVMTGEVIAGIGSTASILYYNDAITYPDGKSEPMDLQVLPMPKAAGKKFLVTQAGVGLCARKTTGQKTEAATVFAKWLTEAERNLSFCVETGYMPVRKDAFAKIKGHAFPSQGYQNLYNTLETINATATAVREPTNVHYYDKVHALYEALKKQQAGLAGKMHTEEEAQKRAEEIWALFCAIQ
ncbi:extracellular solute-binding protein [Murdochiella vaginalis]|uniref:extracellular solute-binding protein n=1 Tax=Murdochiella vaginalis TaxID=1852373 RepID=UPI0009F352C2|nr:extracellular solute-binding protein [Murdochiella vaginalis]